MLACKAKGWLPLTSAVLQVQRLVGTAAMLLTLAAAHVYENTNSNVAVYYT